MARTPPEPSIETWGKLSFPSGVSEIVHVDRSSLSAGLEDALWVSDVNSATLDLAPSKSSHVVLPAGEAGKSWPAVEQILRAALDAGIDRGGTIVAVGGGVVCDVAAFAASIYLRGIQVFLIPSTLLAMVDAAIGGKTGINYAGFKNMVGTFHAAREVRICEALLETLPEREFLSGLAESIKAGILGDGALVELFERRQHEVLSRDSAVLTELIRRSVAVKVGVVQADFRESGQRAYLNLGHTFAHALESVAGFGEWTHGEAVAWGIARALKLGVRVGATHPQYAQRITAILESYGYRTSGVSCSTDLLIEAMHQDKKRRSGAVRFILSRGLGDTIADEVPETYLRAVLEE